MIQMICSMLRRPRWSGGRELNVRHCWCRAGAGDVWSPLTKVDRVRRELAGGVCPLEAHLDAVLELLLTMLSRRPE